MFAFAEGVPRFARRAILAVLVVLGSSACAVAAEKEAVGSERLEQDQAETHPEMDRAEILAGLYDQLSKAEDADSAETIAETIEEIWLESGSVTVDVLMSRALSLVQNNDYDQAIEILDSVTAIAPDFSEGWNQRATVYFIKRDYEHSLDDLRHVLAIDPHHFKAINGLALILQELGDKPAALKAYRKALQVHPHLEGANKAIEELERDVEGQGI